MAEIKEFQDVKPKQGKKKRNVRGVIDGTLLTRDFVIKQLPYIIFLAAIALIYIGNRYQAERIVRESTALQKELRDLRSESISISSELMEISKQSEVLKLVQNKNLDLIESREPPKVIEVEK